MHRDNRASLIATLTLLALPAASASFASSERSCSAPWANEDRGATSSMEQDSQATASSFTTPHDHSGSATQSLKRELTDRLLQYTRIGTQAEPSSERVPSSQGQWHLLQMLRNELVALGNASGIVMPGSPSLDENGYLTLRTFASDTQASQRSNATIAFFAHVDTATEVAGAPVQPLVHEYTGGDLSLPSGDVIPAHSLEQEACAINHTIVTSDGTTLLGADDKNAVAVLMSLLRRVIQREIQYHPRLLFVFNPDEEVGHMLTNLQLSAPFPDAAYTLDASAIGDVQRENFHAEKVRVSFHGHSIHPGNAKHQLVNALSLGAQLLSRLPSSWAAEHSESDQGFILPLNFQGGVHRASGDILLRSFDRSELAFLRQLVQAECNALQAQEPRANVTCAAETTYQNMRHLTQGDDKAFELLKQATEKVVGYARETRMRGGTDGAGLASRYAIPAPNLGVGWFRAHSKTEFASVDHMSKAMRICEELLSLWA